MSWNRSTTRKKKTKSGLDYWGINAKGQVPVLELDNGERITEGPVIVQYLADQKPASGLAPANGSMERVRVQEWLNFTTSEIHKTFGPIFRPTTPDAFKDLSKENLGKWPNVKAYVDRVAARPKVQEAMKAEGLIQ